MTAKKPPKKPKLKPCPFCGRDATLTGLTTLGDKRWWVDCAHPTCPATAYVYAKTRAEVVRRWNRRTK